MLPRTSKTVIVRPPFNRHRLGSRSTVVKAGSTRRVKSASNYIHKIDSRALARNKSRPQITTKTNLPSTPSLALLLDACYALDQLICSTTTSPEISRWHALNPWKYLSSAHLISEWKTSLESLCHEFTTAKLTPDAFEKKLIALLPGLQRLEEARERVTNDLEEELLARGVRATVPDTFWRVVERRVSVIADVFDDMGRRLDAQ